MSGFEHRTLQSELYTSYQMSYAPSQSDQIHMYILIKGQLFITTLLVYSQNSKLGPLTVFLSKEFFFLLNLAQFRTRPNCNYIFSL